MSSQNPIGNKVFRGKDRNNTLYFQIIMVAKNLIMRKRIFSIVFVKYE